MTTHYYKIDDKNTDFCTKFLELDADFYCTRQIVCKNERLINASIEVEGEFFLSEGSFEAFLPFFTEKINQNDFEKLWERSKMPYLSAWNALKQSAVVGSEANGRILCFYPQGIALDMGQPFYAIADYQVCKAVFGAENLYPNTVLPLKISGFDQTHFWVQLSTDFKN